MSQSNRAVYPTQMRLQWLFDFEPTTGRLAWKNSNSKKGFNGKIAGGPMSCGYRCVGVDGKTFYEHRLIWIWANGEIGNYDIDHINNDRADNRLCNLRLATRSQNLARKQSVQTSGLPKGVYLAKRGKNYSARIRREYLGTFPTVEEAVSARQNAAARLGDFAA